MKYEDKIYEEHKSKTCIVYLYLLLAERGICMDRKKQKGMVTGAKLSFHRLLVLWLYQLYRCAAKISIEEVTSLVLSKCLLATITVFF